jgi:hypothetical protein
MFGEKWEPATATIVAKKWKTGDMESGSIYEFVADVQANSGAPAFRTEMHKPALTNRVSFRDPNDGQTVRAEANAKKQQARFDMADPNLTTKHAFDADKDNFEAAKAGAVGTTPASPVDALAGEDPRLQLLRVRIKTATMQGNQAEVDRLTEVVRKVEAGELPMPGSAPAPAADPLDRLMKLADLHAAGALTDEEFAQQKAKILEQT